MFGLSKFSLISIAVQSELSGKVLDPGHHLVKISTTPVIEAVADVLVLAEFTAIARVDHALAELPAVGDGHDRIFCAVRYEYGRQAGSHVMHAGNFLAAALTVAN
jgi:hypothetical protein